MVTRNLQDATVRQSLETLREELSAELMSVLRYWEQNMPDPVHGGFYGKIDGKGRVHPQAPKGLILNSRILWTFSAAGNFFKNNTFLPMADRAFAYLLSHFTDTGYGGMYWQVDYTGRPLDTKKQIYALAFAIYGLSEYYRCSRIEKARETAIGLYRLIEQHSYDPVQGGYLEAFTREWSAPEDLRLSEKDENEKKTMNTHLHILEAYTNLYGIWPDETLGRQLARLCRLFPDHIVDLQTHHLRLFFNGQWEPRGHLVSYGHDIEAAWLLPEAASATGQEALVEEMKGLSMALARAAQEGLDRDGGLWYETEGDHWIREKHWWPQAEALVGFFNAWQLTGNPSWLQRVLDTWGFIKQYIIDHEKGEWHWGIKEDHRVMEGQDKAGFWKCPYHNGRACLELLKRI